METLLEEFRIGVLDIIHTIQEWVLWFWEIIYSFLSKYLSDTLIQIFGIALLFLVILLVALKIINHR